MSKHKVLKAFAPEDTWSFQGKDNKGNEMTVTLRTHYLDLDDGKKIAVHKKPEFEGFKPLEEYDFDISGEKTKSGKHLKAKHVTSMGKCPECGFEGALGDFRGGKTPQNASQSVLGGTESSPQPTSEPEYRDEDFI